MRNGFDIVGTRAALRQQSTHLRQIRDGVQAERSLLAAKRTVQVRADTNVPDVPGDLANVIDMIHNALQPQVR